VAEPTPPYEAPVIQAEGSSSRDKTLPKASAIVAALLSLILPGLGHVYARQTRRGAWWLATLLFGFVALGASLRVGPAVAALAAVVLAFDVVGIRLGTVIDAAWVVSRRGGPRASARTILVGAVVILGAVEANAIGLRRYVVEAFKIPSGSMIPTLLVGDHIFVDKLRSPARGDMLVFPFPEHPNQDFVKRIIGLPGDRLRFRAGHPIINDVEVPSCYMGRASYDDWDSPVTHHEGKVYLETLGGRAYLTFYDDGSVDLSEQGPYVVDEGEAFVVGDNRWNAHDSRMWWGGRGGGVPLATAKGVPFSVWLSGDERGLDWSRSGLGLDRPHVPTSMAPLQPELERCMALLQ
jgi:signal peptidase I